MTITFHGKVFNIDNVLVYWYNSYNMSVNDEVLLHLAIRINH